MRFANANHRFLLQDIGWQGYQTMLDLLGDRPIRLTYDRGTLELMSPRFALERYKRVLGRIIEAITEELDIPAVGAGSTTIHREDLDRGLEPDECYSIAHADRIANQEHIDLATDPPPDLAVEVEISRSAMDRLGIYAALGVPELWRFDGETLTVHQRRPDGQYQVEQSSLAFPFLPMDEVSRFIQSHHPARETAWARSFRAWVRDELRPRYEQWLADRAELD